MTRLVFDRAVFAYGGKRVLGPADLVLEPGQVTALVGPNGAGKSTLLRLAAGLLAPDEGAVQLDGEGVAGLDPRIRARRIAYMPPDGRSAWPLTVRRVAALGRIPWLKPLRRMGIEDEARIEAALRRTGVDHLAERRFDTLSSGEKARVLLARALAGEAGLIVLDEPTAALDIRHQLAVMAILRDEAARGAGVLVAVHALDLAAAHADRVIVLDQGEVAADGAPDEALSPDTLARVFGVMADRAPGAGGFRPVPDDA